MNKLYQLSKSQKRMVKAAWADSLARRLEVLKEIGASKKQIAKEVAQYTRIINSIDRK